MHQGKYIFSQITDFLNRRKFERIVEDTPDKTITWQLTYWNQLMVLILGQLLGCKSLRELTDITTAHARKSYHLGFGSGVVNRSLLSRANSIRNPKIFEAFASYMISIAQDCRIDKEFELYGKFYAFDSSTIDLCMSIFEWAKFKSTKSGIKLHTQIDVVTQIPTLIIMTNANVADVNAMDLINYEPQACYIFDRGYWDLARLHAIDTVGSFFVIREKGKPKYEVKEGGDMTDNDNILFDQTVRFTTERNCNNYPSVIRRIAAYIPELKRTFVFYTNNFFLKAADIVFLYKNRWKVELFFKWIKQHLRVKTFWGTSENAVRIQIYTAIITYCLVAIIEHKMKLNRNVFEVMRIMSSALLTKEHLRDLFEPVVTPTPSEDPRQLSLNFYAD